MRAIVVFYNGSPVDISTAKSIIDAISPILAEGHSQPEIKYFSDEDISRELLKTTTPPKRSTEEGDCSVKVIMSMIPTSCLENRLSLAVALTRQLSISSASNDAKDHAFCKAMSFIAQKEPISPEVAKQYHFTKMVRECVTEVYNAYLNM